MTTLILMTQVVSIVGFVFLIFGLYRLLVKTKDATIDLLKQRIADLESKLAEARNSAPDRLLPQLRERIQAHEEELKRLLEDADGNAEAIAEKERQLEKASEDIGSLQEILERADLCPDCYAPVMEKKYASESVWYGGRDIDVDHEYVAYECGREVIDGRETSPCEHSMTASWKLKRANDEEKAKHS